MKKDDGSNAAGADGPTRTSLNGGKQKQKRRESEGCTQTQQREYWEYWWSTFGKEGRADCSANC